MLMLFSLAAVVVTAIGVAIVVLRRIEIAVSRAVAREAALSRVCLATAVAEALADELEHRENPPPRLTSVR